MAKRGRKPRGTLASIAVELEQLESRRHELIQQLRRAADALSSADSPVPGRARTAGSARRAGTGRRRRGGRRKGFKMSAEARAKISAAAKKRWAAQKKEG